MSGTPGTSPKVMIVDDSAVVRRHLAERLQSAGIAVIGTAADPLFALPRMRAEWPDVIVLDVEMPRMDGISFLRQIMAERPTPVVMCSTLTERGGETTMQALAAGAVGFVTKPRLGLKDFLEDEANGIVAAVRAAAQANVRALRAAPLATAAARLPATAAAVGGLGTNAPAGAGTAPPAGLAPAGSGALSRTTDRVVAIGVSTGGVQTIESLLTRLPRTAPGIVIVQHMPAQFTASLAARLNTLCDIEVAEARDGDRVVPGRALIAPGGRHLQLRRSGAQYLAAVSDGPLVNRHRPSVDVLFRSVAHCAGANAIGVILTGMGDDGARGLLEMRQRGALTAAQDEASCVVYGMPREAVRRGAAAQTVTLDEMPGWLMQAAAAVPA